MQWYEPKEKTAKIDWRCDTPYWNFKIINLDDKNLALYNTQYNDLIKTSDNIDELHFCAYRLQLMVERKMSLDKAIEHHKEYRKQYYGSKAIDPSCRNHGGV